MAVEDLVQFERVSAPTLSPDGKQVAYLLRRTDMEANKGRTALWLQSLANGEPRRMTELESNASEPSWSADGQSLYFLSSRSGLNQLWRLDLAGGEAQAVSELPLDVLNYQLSPNGGQVAFSLEVFTDCPDLACTTQRLDARKAEKHSAQVFDAMFVRHWDTWADGRRNQLFVAAIGEDGKLAAPIRVSAGVDGDISSKPFGGNADYAWSADGRSLVFSARLGGSSEAWSTNFDLYSVPADGSAAPSNLTEANKAWDANPLFSADGKTLYYLAMQRPGFEADRFAIMARDLASGATREIAPSWDRSAGSLALAADGKRLLTDSNDLGEHALFAIDIKTGKASKLAGGGSVAGFDQVGKHLVFARSTLTEPAQLFVADAQGRGTRQLSRFNSDRLADIAMGEYEQFSFSGWNNEQVHGYVVKPWNYTQGQKYPVAYIIHGGPQGSMGNNFHYRWNPQTYAGQGWAVVFIDFHGSTGYGQAFTDSISQDWGGKPLEDLQKGWAAALAKYDFLDGDRACALGASYGGFMVNWIAGVWTQPWRCLVSHSGVFDQRMMGYATEELWFTEWENGGSPYQVPGNYEKFNPVTRVSQWQVPMLVIHGQLDFRIPVEQSLAVFHALQRRGVDSKFVYYPDENHWILKPANSVHWHNEVNGWLQRHFEGAGK
nr:S9 family peptidase [Pseudomarimonas arenosa]